MRAVLFDVDGVVLDSMAIYRRVWRQWCLRAELDPDAVWPLTHGRRPQDTIAMVAPHLAVESELLRLSDFLDQESSPLPAMLGAKELLADLPEERWALVTSNSEHFVQSEFARLGLPWPRVIVDGGAVQHGKPSPEGFLAASRRLGCPTSDCLVVEDAPAGVAAGLAAGMRVLAIEPTPADGELAMAHARFPSLEAASRAIRNWVFGPDPERQPPGSAVDES
ncbi:MAG: HAD-IA family hydrolase [Candidatus Dormibacteria bacterium]